MQDFKNIYPLPSEHKDIELNNFSIRILHANLNMSVPKISDVCHMHMYANCCYGLFDHQVR